MKQIVNELSNGYTLDIKPMEVTETNEIALSRQSRLCIGSTYLFPAQVFHAKPIVFNNSGDTVISNRAACFEISEDGSLTGIKTMSYSALRALYLGRVTYDSDIPTIRAEIRDGLIRPIRGTAYISNKKGGEPPIEAYMKDGKKVAVIKYPFALKVTGRCEFYTTVLERRDDGRYDMQVEASGNLAIASRNDYEFEYIVPSQEMLESFNPMKDMPELKDYLLTDSNESFK